MVAVDLLPWPTWGSLSHMGPFDSRFNKLCVSGLKNSLAKLDTQLWTRAEPETFLWVSLTGVAAAAIATERAWCVAKVGLQ
jgi:hypothetical protein